MIKKRIEIKTKPEEAFTVVVDDEYAFTVSELRDISYAYECMRRSIVETYLYKNDDIEARLETKKSKVSLIYQYFHFGPDDEMIIELVDYLEKRFEKIIIDQNEWETDVTLDDYEVTLRCPEDYIYNYMLVDEIKKIADELKQK